MSSEATLRLASFVGVLLVMLIAERAWPKRPTPRFEWRMVWNLTLVAFNQLLVRVAVPVLPAVLAASRFGDGHGPFALMPRPLAFILAIVVFDGLIWAQHLLFHRVSPLWALHRLHHADPVYDTTTALRFHPVEILLSMGIKLAAVWVLAPPPEAIIAFEVILNAMAMFNHANLALPQAVDQVLRAALVTPDVHRVHHSVRPEEAHTNFGFNLVIWDRMFGTYTAQPAGGHVAMAIGAPTAAG